MGHIPVIQEIKLAEVTMRIKGKNIQRQKLKDCYSMKKVNSMISVYWDNKSIDESYKELEEKTESA